MLKIGLTGGIGAGKTVVSDYFQHLGVAVLDTDIIAREVVQPGSEVLQQLAQCFGNDILNPAGALQRERLRAKVFSDPTKKQTMEDIIHPAIRQRLLQQLETLASAATSPYCIIVIPLLLEKNWQALVDRVLLVLAPEQEKIKRIKARQEISHDEIQQIMLAQASDDQRRAIADDILDNDGNIEQLHRQIDTLHQRYLRLVHSQ